MAYWSITREQFQSQPFTERQNHWNPFQTQHVQGIHCDSLGTRPSHAEEEEGLVNLHTYKFEVRGISAEWIWLVDDCVITFLPTKARVRVITTWRIWLTDQRLIQESKRPSFNKLRYSPANLEQLESCYERDRSLRFHYLSSGTVKVPLLR